MSFIHVTQGSSFPSPARLGSKPFLGVCSCGNDHQCTSLCLVSLFSVTKEPQLTNKYKYDEIVATCSLAMNHVPFLKRPVSKHFQRQIYNSSAVPLNLLCPPTPWSHKLQLGRTGDGSVAWKGHRHPLASKWEPWLLLSIYNSCLPSNPSWRKHPFMFLYCPRSIDITALSLLINILFWISAILDFWYIVFELPTARGLNKCTYLFFSVPLCSSSLRNPLPLSL